MFHLNQYFFWFQATALPTRAMFGPKMATTSQGDGLIMTHEKNVFTYQCKSETGCKWSKEPYSLQISRYWHVMLPVVVPFLDNCWWNKP